MDLEFTGEYFVPGKSPKTVEEDHMARYRFATPFVKGKRVLDIACGSGYGTRLLAAAGALAVDGVDLSEKVIAYAKSRYSARNVSFSVGNVVSYSSALRYDVIVCFETVEHVREYEAVLANLFSLLVEGGMLLISSPNRPITSPKAKRITDRPGIRHHVQEFTIDELVHFLRARGFIVRNSDVYGQRQQRHFRNRFLRRLYTNFWKPDSKRSPEVSQVGSLAPRYFLIIARK